MYQDTVHERACDGCGSEFTPSRGAASRQRFCTEKCGKRAWQRARKIPNRLGQQADCAICGEVFVVRHVVQIYCSTPCRAAAARAKVPQRWRHASSRYGISPDRFEAMFAAQDRRCAICFVELNGTERDRDAPQVDHDHETGRVRQILCRLCNTALGNMRDDPVIVRAALAYLERWHVSVR